VRLCQGTLSNCYVQKGDLAKGEKVLEAILVEQPDDASVNNDLGYLYADEGKQLQRAEKMIKIALKAEPDNVAYIDSMGWVCFKLGKLEEARKYLEKAVKNPAGSDGTIWEHLGDCYDRMGAHDKATGAWKEALKNAKQEAFPDQKLVERLQNKLSPSAADDKHK
jgi:Tfp pilus assembly protein PilF